MPTSKLTTTGLWLALTALTSAASVPIQRRGAAQVHYYNPAPFADASPDVLTENYIQIEKSEQPSRSSQFLAHIRNSAATGDVPTSALQEISGGLEYLTKIKFGDQEVSVIVDTGSSDTWLIKDGFRCVNQFGSTVSTQSCNFGPAYQGDFDSKIPNEHFNISYGDGEFVTGPVGTKDITIAGITVPQQPVALGTYAYWNGDSTASGLMGLAFSAITSFYTGDENSKGGEKVNYDPLFTTMWKKNLSTPVFSIAIIEGQGGYIGFGGLPPVGYTNTFAAAPIEMISVRLNSTTRGMAQAFYAMTPSAVTYQGAIESQQAQWIVDSGTTLTYAPSAVAKKINSMFNPPATYTNGMYVIKCNAKAPVFGIQLGDNMLPTRRMILPDTFTGQSGVCLSGVQDGGSSGPYILGDTWMSGVLSVFDIGKAEMRFAINNY
jgi:hypothetical protein